MARQSAISMLCSSPDNIRSLVLDGVVNPFENNPDEGDKYSEFTATTSGNLDSELTQIQGFQSTFEEFLKKCASEGFAGKPCALGNASDDVQTLLGEYQKIAQAAWGGAYYETTESSPRPVSFADVTTGTILAMYSDSFWESLNDSLQELKDNATGDGIMELADNYYERDSSGLYSYSDSAFQTIWCTDSGVEEQHDAQAAIENKRKQYEVAPFTDPGVAPNGEQRGLEPSRDWCSYYKVKGTLPTGQSLAAMPNILYISTTYDPATPYQDGVVAAAASAGTLLTVAGNVHTSYYPGSNDCADEITTSYFINLTVPDDITGDKGVKTKDIYSKVITGNQCAVHSFRPETMVESKAVTAGETVTLNASGLVRNTDYKLELPAGYKLTNGDTVKANVDGKAVFNVVAPADAQAGEVEFTLLPADPAANDPQVRAAGKLQVSVPAQVADPTKPVDAAQHNGDKPKPQADKVAPVKPEPAKADAAKSGDRHLANTGGEFGGMLSLAGALLALVGAATIAVAKRRKRVNS